MPAATVGIWPFEEMYRDEVRATQGNRKYDNDERRKYAQNYLDRIEWNASLVFYYANYSNPYSEDDARKYVIVGASRVKTVSKIRNYTGMTAEDRAKYGGGFIWEADLTSHYPDEGLRLPYHAYADRPDEVARFLVVPPNPRNFKYTTRQFSDDEGLELIERLIEAVTQLKEMGDTSENWDLRLSWLQAQVGRLWSARGLYPGMTAILETLGATGVIPWFKYQAENGREQAAKDAIFAFFDGAGLAGPALNEQDAKSARRSWKLLDRAQQDLLKEAIVRLDLPVEQLKKILSPDVESFGITAGATEMTTNPYVLAEQFVGDDSDDVISFTKVDHGMLPSPELGGSHLASVDDARRLRALCVEHLRRQTADVFAAGEQLIRDINERLSVYPEWKRHQFTPRYLEADREELEGALVILDEQSRLWVYLKSCYDDERVVENQLRRLETRADIALRIPMTDDRWRDSLRDAASPLARRASTEYDAAIAGQAEVCAKIFRKPLCVLSGQAGTGKTTVVKSLLDAIERTEGVNATFQLLAPTGKAAERLRERTGRRSETATVHSFLARNGWLNDNFTLKRRGGKREDSFATYVIDECSMLSVDVVATLFRAINWNSVRRLILVGDPSQLPPIGRGRVFADVIDWLRPLDAVGELTVNVRQMENRVIGRGTALLELADAYLRRSPAQSVEEADTTSAEEILDRVQQGGDIDQDLRVLFWNGQEDLTRKLVDQIVADAETDLGERLEGMKNWEFWKQVFDQYRNPERFQVLSPYRGDVHGTEALNAALQEAIHGQPLAELRQVDGIALYDKVIQVRNRPRSRPMWAYNYGTRKNEKVEVYNGEMGFAKPHPFDRNKLGWAGFRPERFRVSFSTKPDFGVDYGEKESVEENLELGYAVSVHKAQGSEFDRIYFVVPKHRKALLSRELFYTGLTRAVVHCTLLVEEDISSLLSMRRLEQSRLVAVNASLFAFSPVPDELRRPGDWYQEGKIHSTLTSYMVRSKSEVIIANMLFERDVPFTYETPLYAPDGTFVLPDFTVAVQGSLKFWEHVGMLDDTKYRRRWETKKAWYEKHFPGQLLTTQESPNLSRDASELIDSLG
jgi:hypothetical protein